MGIDHGEARIGIALSDPLGVFATPHSVLKNANLETILTTLQAIINREGITKLVIGLPTDSEDKVGPQARIVIEWARELGKHISVPIVFWDESFSSVDALTLHQASGKRRPRNAALDDLVAAFILQDYLDAVAGKEDYEPGRTIESLAEI